MRKTVYVLTKEGGNFSLFACDEIERIIRNRFNDDSELVYNMLSELNNPEILGAKIDEETDCYIAVTTNVSMCIGNKDLYAAFREKLRTPNGQTSWQIGMDQARESARKGFKSIERL